MTFRLSHHLPRWLTITALCVVALSGCGTTALRSATDQMLASDAVDQAVSKIDFAPLSGQKVFFESKYLEPVGGVNGIGFVNASYVASALRQQMLAAGVYLMEKDQADIVVEARIGILGADRNDLVYGIPASNASGLASATAGTPLPMVIPEVSFARKVDQTAAAKVACYAYTREGRERVWQSGTSVAKANSKDTWVLGAGPFQKSSVQNGVRFAGSSLQPFEKVERRTAEGGYDETIVFRREEEETPDDKDVQHASAEQATPQPVGEAPKLQTPPAATPATGPAKSEPAKAEPGKSEPDKVDPAKSPAAKPGDQPAPVAEATASPPATPPAAPAAAAPAAVPAASPPTSPPASAPNASQPPTDQTQWKPRSGTP